MLKSIWICFFCGHTILGIVNSRTTKSQCMFLHALVNYAFIDVIIPRKCRTEPFVSIYDAYRPQHRHVHTWWVNNKDNTEA